MSKKDNEIIEYEPSRDNGVRGKFRSFMSNKIVIAIASIVFGLILVVWQREAVDTLVRILGIIMIAIAAVFILMYIFKKENKKPGYLVAGIILAIIGVFFLARPALIVVLFPFIMGIILIISGVMDLVNVIGLPKEAPGRTGYMAVSIIILAMGVVFLFRPSFIAGILILLIGIMLLFNGVFDLVVIATQRWKKE